MRRGGTFGGMGLALCLAGTAASETHPTSLLGHFLYHAQVVTDEATTVGRLDVDVTGDGVPELLLAKGERIPFWFIYEKAGTGTYRFLGNLSFMSEYFRVDRGPLRIVVSLPNPGGIWNTVVLQYRRGDPPFQECVPRGSAECRDTGEDFAKWRERSGIRHVYARLADLEASDNPEWLDRETVASVTGLGGLRRLLVSNAGRGRPQ